MYARLSSMRMRATLDRLFHTKLFLSRSLPHSTLQLFLFNYSTRQLHGVYVRDGPPGMNLEPQAWAQYRRPGDSSYSSPFPAQVRWREFKVCRAIREALWSHVPPTLPGNGKGGKPMYDLFMSGQQAQQLAQLCIQHG